MTGRTWGNIWAFLFLKMQPLREKKIFILMELR